MFGQFSFGQSPAQQQLQPQQQQPQQQPLFPTQSPDQQSSFILKQPDDAAKSQPSEPPGMTFKQLEDSVNMWLNDLNVLEQDFRKQAQSIDTWEALSTHNSVKILESDQQVETLKAENTKLDRALDFIVEQQQEIDKLLLPIERMKLDPKSNSDRDKTYNFVETIQNELQSFSDDIQNFVGKLNDLKSADRELDPITQIERVLNAQIDALQYIEINLNKCC